MRTKTAPRVGRPPSPYPLRLPVRHDEELLELWRIAAARAGVDLQAWIREVLAREAKKPTHVAPLGGRRRG